MTKLNLENLLATNDVITRLNILRRWTSILTEDKYNELAKQALNCITSYMLAGYCEQAGECVSLERFPKIALYRAFQKVYVYFDTPEHIIDEVCAVGGVNRTTFSKVTKEIIIGKTDEDFASFLCEGQGTYEERIYQAATKVATLVELFENKAAQHDMRAYADKLLQIQDSLSKYDDIPGVSELSNIDGRMFQLLRRISRLRNQNRWAVHAYCLECSVLGHLFDTAVWAYFIGLESFGGNEDLATKMFFMGIFHDLAEAWTTDIPSPIKDCIPGFRLATENYEKKVLEDNLYSVVPSFLQRKLHFVMFEDEENASFKKMMKGADYLSADSECWRQYFAGTRDEYFYEAMSRNNEKIASNAIVLSSKCIELHSWFLAYAKKCVKCVR